MHRQPGRRDGVHQGFIRAEAFDEFRQLGQGREAGGKRAVDTLWDPLGARGSQEIPIAQHLDPVGQFRITVVEPRPVVLHRLPVRRHPHHARQNAVTQGNEQVVAVGHAVAAPTERQVAEPRIGLVEQVGVCVEVDAEPPPQVGLVPQAQAFPVVHHRRARRGSVGVQQVFRPQPVILVPILQDGALAVEEEVEIHVPQDGWWIHGAIVLEMLSIRFRVAGLLPAPFPA